MAESRKKIASPGFRGCAFLNAVAEYPQPEHPVHRVVLAHRQWFLDTVRALLAGVEDSLIREHAARR